MQTRTIKRIFTNMDGALLNSKGQVSERNARRIRRADIPITLVSARAPMEMREAIELLGLQGPQVGFNGGLIWGCQSSNSSAAHQDYFQADRGNDFTGGAVAFSAGQVSVIMTWIIGIVIQ